MIFGSSKVISRQSRVLKPLIRYRHSCHCNTTIPHLTTPHNTISHQIERPTFEPQIQKPYIY